MKFLPSCSTEMLRSSFLLKAELMKQYVLDNCHVMRRYRFEKWGSKSVKVKSARLLLQRISPTLTGITGPIVTLAPRPLISASSPAAAGTAAGTAA